MQRNAERWGLAYNAERMLARNAERILWHLLLRDDAPVHELVCSTTLKVYDELVNRL